MGRIIFQSESFPDSVKSKFLLLIGEGIATLDTITQAIDSNLQVGLGQKIREAGGVDLCPA